MLRRVGNAVHRFVRWNDEFSVWCWSYTSANAGVIVAERECSIQGAIRIEPHDRAGRLVCEGIEIGKHNILAVGQKYGPRSKNRNGEKWRVKVLIEAERARLRVLADYGDQRSQYN